MTQESDERAALKRAFSLPKIDLLSVENIEDEIFHPNSPVWPVPASKSNRSKEVENKLTSPWFSLSLAGSQVAETGAYPKLAQSKPQLRKESQFNILHALAVTGEKNRLQKLINSGLCDLNAQDKFGRTALTFAVLGGHPDVCDVLMKAGSRLGIKDNSGRSALHWAAHHGNIQCLKILLNHKRGGHVCWDDADNGGVTVVHLATRWPSSKCLPLLLKHFTLGQHEVNIQDDNKRTPLHWAASQGGHEYVRLLLKYGASADVIDVEGKTPLHWAASSGISVEAKQKQGSGRRHLGSEVDAVKTVQVLVSLLPNLINWKDYEDRTALHLGKTSPCLTRVIPVKVDYMFNEAVADSSDEVVLALLKAGVKSAIINTLDSNYRTALHWAAVLGKNSVCTILLEHQAKYNCKDGNGATPLHYAVKAGHLEAVEVLMRRPDVLDHPDLMGRTALMWAAASSSLKTASSDMILALSRHGSDLHHRDLKGSTALHIAVTSRNSDAVRTLLKMGIDINVANYQGNTALCLAGYLGDLEAVDNILASKPVRYTDNQGHHALHKACMMGHAHLIKLLMGHLEVVDWADVFGRTALILAAFGGYVYCVDMLLALGADLTVVDNEGMSCLHWATVRGHLDVVQLLLSRRAPVNQVARQRLDRGRDETFTPLESAIANEHNEITDLLVESGALTSRAIRESAATRIQAAVRGYLIKKSFEKHKHLLLRHEELRSAKKRSCSTGNGLVPRCHGNEEKSNGSGPTKWVAMQATGSTECDRVMGMAGHFLGHVVEARHIRRLHTNDHI